jgi:DNA polymerase
VGASGTFLNEMLEEIGLKRDAVYITNIVKDRPPENRDPTPAEIALYAPFLNREIEIIQPKIIATLGRFAMAYCMKTYTQASDDTVHLPISKLHGTAHRMHTSYGTCTLVPLYHPAVALYNGSMRTVLKKDFKIIKKYLKKAYEK